jgi:hypothetical protein
VCVQAAVDEGGKGQSVWVSSRKISSLIIIQIALEGLSASVLSDLEVSPFCTFLGLQIGHTHFRNPCGPKMG